MKKQGFTLVEMMVVVAVIGVLVAAVLPSTTGVMDKAKRAKAVGEVRSIATAAIAFRDDSGRWPDDLNNDGNGDHSGVRHPLNELIPTAQGSKRYLTNFPHPDPWKNDCGYRFRIRNDGWFSFVASRGPDRICNSCICTVNTASGDDDVFYLN